MRFRRAVLIFRFKSRDKTKAFLFRRATGQNLREPQYARTFHWGADGSNIGAVVESYRSNTRRADIIRARMDTDEKEIYADVAQVITGI